MASLSSTKATQPPPDKELPPEVATEPGDLPTDIIDMDTFGQLLEMDDEDDRTFSQEIVWNFFEQANSTFLDMDKAFESEDLPKLSTLGHFLKGSSAAVGVIHVRDGCEAMQHLGKQHDESGVMDLSREEALKKVKEILEVIKKEYTVAETALKRFYEEEGSGGPPNVGQDGE